MGLHLVGRALKVSGRCQDNAINQGTVVQFEWGQGSLGSEMPSFNNLLDLLSLPDTTVAGIEWLQ